MTKTKKHAKLAIAIPLLILTIALIVNPTRYIASVYGGLLLFATNVLPSLLPFFFFSKALTAIGCVSLISRATARPLAKLYNAPPTAGYILVMSIMSGYPIGASLVASLYQSGDISQNDARSIISFTSTSGPLFIIGSIASGMLSNMKAGYIILLCHYIGAILNGLIYRQKPSKIAINSLTTHASTDTTLGDIALSSAQNIMLVGVYIAIFSMAIDCVADLRIFSIISNIFSRIGIPKDITRGILSAFIEVTRGVFVLSESGHSLKIIAPIICGLVSFGGIAITLQSLTFLSKCGIKANRYLLTKFSQSVISILLAIPFSIWLL